MMIKQRIYDNFKPNTPKHIKSIITKICNQNQLYLEEKLLSHKNFAQIIKYLLKWNELSFYTKILQQQEPSLLKCICSIEFQNLKYLYLQKIGISNFEAFQWINAPNISILYMMNNNAYLLKSLGKTKFLTLKKLQIDDHYHISELSHLAKMKFGIDSQIKTKPKIQNNQAENENLPEFMIIQIFKMGNKCKFFPNKNQQRQSDIFWIKLNQRNKITH